MIQYDCHAHVFERIATIPGARYTPSAPATLNQWLNHLHDHALLGGVIVQVSFLGTDNRELCSALARLGPSRFAGVAVVDPAIDAVEIDQLYERGVRGFRWNMVRGGNIPDLNDITVRRFLDRVYSRNMHIEVHLEGPRLARFIGPLLKVGGKVVVDHFGLPTEEDPVSDPWLQSLQEVDDRSQLFVKCSASYRCAINPHVHAAILLKLLSPDRLLWGSDWPHTQYTAVADYNDVARTREHSVVTSDAKAVKALYGLG
jgi:predicted TIM-barrel fold metal-dependent hydrolase